MEQHGEVLTIIPAGVEPHTYEPTAADIADLSDIDIFIALGIGFDHIEDPVLAAIPDDAVVLSIPPIIGSDEIIGLHDEDSDDKDMHDMDKHDEGMDKHDEGMDKHDEGMDDEGTCRRHA